MDYEWEEAVSLYDETLEQVLLIIDDALCFGFTFKVENYKLYWKDSPN